MDGLESVTSLGEALAQARLWIEQGRLQEAQTLLDQISKAGFETPDCLLLKARLAKAENRPDLAEGLFGKALEANPFLDEALTGLIGLYEASGRIEQARHLVATAIQGKARESLRFEAHLKSRIANPNPVLFDVGAHHGETIERLRRLFPGAHIHAFEPDPVLAARLERDQAGFERTNIVASGLGAAKGWMTFHRNQADATGGFLPLEEKSAYVAATGNHEIARMQAPVTTLDAYCQENGIGFVDFLKLDVQGYEDECLQGAAALLADKAIGAIQLEIITARYYGRPGSFLNVERHLLTNGWRLAALFDICPETGGPLFQLDALYLPS